MLDPFLYELMHKVSPPSKLNPMSLSDPLNVAFEEAVKAEVEAIRSEQKDFGLLSEEAFLKKVESEVRDAADLSEFGEHIHHAVEIIRSGERYLEKDNYNLLNLSLDKISQEIRALDLKNFTEEALKNALAIPDEAATSILKIGIDKFSEGLLNDSLDVFSFLALVCPDEPEYWYRMGLVAHKNNQHELALRALHVASDLDKDFLEPHIFSTECYLDLKEYAEARHELDEAKETMAHVENKSWAETILILENLIENREDL